MTGNPKIDRCIDILCGHGCRAVREYIEALNAEVELPYWSDLDAQERQRLGEELGAIMAVYGDKCDI